MREDTGSDAKEVGDILARLRHEVRVRPGTSSRGDGFDNEALPSRWNAETLSGVTADRAFESMPGAYGRVRGLVLTPLKALLRKLMRWYVEPMAVHQRSFNAAVLRLIDELTERESSDVRRLERRVRELEERLAQTEQREPAP